MPVSLEETKTKAYNVYMTQVTHMKNVIEDYEKDPTSLRSSGHPTLEHFLKATIKYTCKEVDKHFKKYEAENPD